MKALVYDLSTPRIILSKLLGCIYPSAYTGRFAALQYREIPDVRLPADDWVLIKTRLCGICGSDYKQVFAIGNWDNPMTALISFPQVLGHEVVGTIERVGPAVTDRRPGERVVLNPWLSCQARGITPPCAACAVGNFARCYNFPKGLSQQGLSSRGIHSGTSSVATGGFAPFVPAHQSMCFPIPDGVSDEQAVLADPFCVSLHAILNFPPEPRDTVVVYGCGTLGLLAVAILRLLYPETRIIAIYKYAQQKVLAEKFGATETVPSRPSRDIIPRIASLLSAEILAPMYGKPMLNGGVQVIYDSVGSAETQEVGLRICDSRGKIVITGVATPKRFEWTPLYFKEVSIIGSNGFGFEDFAGERKHAIEIYFDLIKNRGLDLTPILTHRFPLQRYGEAMLAGWDQGKSKAVKVAFEYPA
jgi:threonine dehydrogenase-like Zn-dependent dehydrogenase